MYKKMKRLLNYGFGILLITFGIILTFNFYYDWFKIDFMNDTYIFLTGGILLVIIGIYLTLDILKKIGIILFGISLMVLGLFQLIHGIQNIVNIADNFSNYLNIAELFIGGIFLLLGTIFLGCFLLPVFIKGLAFILSPILTKMKIIVYRNINRNKKRSQNTFTMIALGLAFIIMIGTVLESLDAGVYPGAKLELGGDIQIGEIWNTHVFGYLNMSNEIKQIDHVKEVIPVHVEWISINYNKNFSESIYLFIINTTEYAKLHSKNTLLTFIEPKGISIDQFIHLLDQENSTIIQYELAKETNIKCGDKVNLSIDSFNTELNVVGIFGRMPGLRFTFVDYWDAMAVIISWKTLFNLMGINASEYDSYAGSRTIAYWLGLDSIYNDQKVISILKTQVYSKIGVNLDSDDIKTARSRVEEYGGIIKVINGTLTNILLFSLLISLIGLAITMFMNVHQRKREIGILRSIGISKNEIIKMIFSECFIISFYGLLFGTLTGIFVGFIMINYFPFIYFLPAIFTIDYNLIVLTIFLVFVFTVISSLIPAYLSNRISIIDAIRSKR